MQYKYIAFSLPAFILTLSLAALPLAGHAEELDEDELKILEECFELTDELRDDFKKLDKFSERWAEAREQIADGSAGEDSDDDEAKKVYKEFRAIYKKLRIYVKGCKELDEIAKKSAK